MNYSYNNGGASGTMLMRALVLVCLIAMFIGGAFMISEGSQKDPAAEPQKMYFGIAHLITAAILAAGYVYSLA